MASSISKAVSGTAAAAAKSPLRLIALPLTRNPELVYYYAHLDRPSKSKGKGKGKEPGGEASTANTANSVVDGKKDAGTSSMQQEIQSVDQAAANKTRDALENAQKGTAAENIPLSEKIPQYISKATNYAAEKWEQFGKAPKGNWKYKTYMMGERMMDRIEFEEWLLKALDASTAPRLRRGRPKVAIENAAQDKQASSSVPDADKVPLYFPPSMLTNEKVLKNITTMLDHREPHHQSLLKKSMILIPFTFPFAIVPIVPNFPMFYVLWRTWSHWRALKSSQYLKALITHRQLQPESSELLDTLYKQAEERGQKRITEAEPAEDGKGPPKLLLDREMVDSLCKEFGLADQAGIDLRRAISQAEARLKSPKPN